VEHSSATAEETATAICVNFPCFGGLAIVHTLIEKFSKLKKTKEELIKYCMRKAFKYILELPKNRHLLGTQEERVSFAKSKNRYLKYPPLYSEKFQKRSP
jgi:hypothetical protein